LAQEALDAQLEYLETAAEAQAQGESVVLVAVEIDPAPSIPARKKIAQNPQQEFP
jgi:hypothetical protein